VALSDAAKGSLSGLWGSYDFYLIRDGHFKEPSEIVDRFLDRYQPRWTKSSRTIDKEFVNHPKKVRELLTEWAEKKLELVAESEALPTLYTNIMFKQLLYDHETINFGSIKTNWKKKVDIAAELEQYKPWSDAHAVATVGGKKKLRKHVESILAQSGTAREQDFFEAWWDLADDEDRPMLFPQVWGHTTGKLWITDTKDRSFPATFSFGLVNVVSRSKVMIQCLPKTSSIDATVQALLTQKRELASGYGWLVFEFTNSQVKNELNECFDALEDFLTF
jgi:hypothetical protein